MRSLVLSGLERRLVARRLGRSHQTVWKHTRGLTVGGPSCEQLTARAGMETRAQRLERLFSSCNQALEAA